MVVSYIDSYIVKMSILMLYGLSDFPTKQIGNYLCFMIWNMLIYGK